MGTKRETAKDAKEKIAIPLAHCAATIRPLQYIRFNLLTERRMFFLGISTVAERTEIALLETTPASNTASPSASPTPIKVLLEKSWKSERDEMEKLFPVLAAALKKMETRAKKSMATTTTPAASATPAAPNLKIFVVEGPGPFTSLRVGVTIANTLGFAYSAPIISMTTFEYLRAKLLPAKRKETAIVLQGGSFFAVALPGVSKPEHVKPHEVGQFLSTKKNVKYYAGNTPPKTDTPAKLPPRIPPSKIRSLSQVLIELTGMKPKTKNLIHPYYLAPPHITQSKKAVFVKR